MNEVLEGMCRKYVEVLRIGFALTRRQRVCAVLQGRGTLQRPSSDVIGSQEPYQIRSLGSDRDTKSALSLTQSFRLDFAPDSTSL